MPKHANVGAGTNLFEGRSVAQLESASNRNVNPQYLEGTRASVPLTESLPSTFSGRAAESEASSYEPGGCWGGGQVFVLPLSIRR